MLDPVRDVYATVLERPALAQLQVDLSAHRVKKMDARPEQYRVDIEPDLIDQSGLEKRSCQLTAPPMTQMPLPF